ncbi:MAG: DUF3095 domain-containing protein [Hyphomicrobiaceae bacterium]
MIGSETFYRDLTPATSFAQASELQYYQRIPDDWTVLIGDIRGSTAAIKSGQYKSVNMVGAAVIIAVLNACPDIDIPFVFGGDGGTLVVPPAARDAARDALARLQVHAKSMFDLELRTGAVTVAALRAGGHDLGVLKLRLSEGNHLAMFAGGGLAYADDWLKAARPGDAILIEPSNDKDLPELEGLSCRWQPLQSQNGMILTIISAGTDPTPHGERTHFHNVTQALVGILGAPLELSAPVSDQTLKFRWPPAGLDVETRATAGTKWRFRRKLEILLQSFIQGTLEFFNGSAGYYDARKYREEMRHNTDFEKYDGMLRLVLDVTVEQAAQIDIYLHGEYTAGRLNYGVHSAKEALMTCVIFSLQESRHVHFIDGANGGFALAAMDLKAQLASRTAMLPYA